MSAAAVSDTVRSPVTVARRMRTCRARRAACRRERRGRSPNDHFADQQHERPPERVLREEVAVAVPPNHGWKTRACHRRWAGSARRAGRRPARGRRARRGSTSTPDSTQWWTTTDMSTASVPSTSSGQYSDHHSWADRLPTESAAAEALHRRRNAPGGAVLHVQRSRAPGSPTTDRGHPTLPESGWRLGTGRSATAHARRDRSDSRTDVHAELRQAADVVLRHPSGTRVHDALPWWREHLNVALVDAVAYAVRS